MKRWPWYLCALLLIAVLGWMPFEGSDVAKLKPVEVVRIERKDSIIMVQTDTGDSGQGQDLPSAFADLKQRTAGQVFLETADYLLIDTEAEPLLPELTAWLRPACGVCICNVPVELEQVALFLNTHSPANTLQRCQIADVTLQRLSVKEGQMKLEW